MLQTMASPLVLLLVGIKLLSLATCGEIDVEQMQSSLAQIGRQLMLQQLFLEERIRSDGDSGLKTIRLNNVGPRPYYAEGVSSVRKVDVFQMFMPIVFRQRNWTLCNHLHNFKTDTSSLFLTVYGVCLN